MKFFKEWKTKDVTRDELNDQLYEGIDPIINPYIDKPTTNSRAYDAKLLAREIVDNIYRHDTPFSISLYFEIKEKDNQKIAKLVIKHNGSNFNPFSEEGECILIKKIKDDIKFTEKIVGTDSVKNSMTIEYNLIEGV